MNSNVLNLDTLEAGKSRGDQHKMWRQGREGGSHRQESAELSHLKEELAS